MLLKKRDRLRDLDFYFAGYDMDQPDCCIWVQSPIAATNINDRYVIDKLINYLYIHSKVQKIMTLEVIENGRPLQKAVPEKL